MIISHEHKFCFIHIPKNGGTYVRSLFEKYHDDPITFYGVKLLKPKKLIKDLSHINIEDLVTLFNAQECNTYFKFCFIRDPIERFKSAYVEYMHHVLKFFGEAPKKVDALLCTIENKKTLLEDARYVHLIPQTSYTHDRNYKQICYTFKMNDLDNEINKICKHLSIDIDLNTKKIHHKNSGKSQAFNKKFVLSDEDLIKIKNIYNKDFELLGFNS